MLKRIKPETYTLIGILVLFVVGSLFHFLYSLTGECFIVGLFVPINESIFEHTKMVVLPIFIWWFIFYLFRKKDLFVNAWFTSALIAMISAIIAIPMLFYFYSQAFGIESLVIDILILLVSLAIGQILGLHYYRHGKGIEYHFAIVLMIVIIIIRTICFGDPVDGWPSLVCIIMFVSGIQLFCIGIMGLYLSKTYLETKHRPVYIIKETEKDI